MAMARDEFDHLRHDPLSQQGRAQHRNLLVVSAIALAVELLHPTRISALGVAIEADKRDLLRLMLVCVVGYLVVAFAVAVRGDWVQWSATLRHAEGTRDTLQGEVNRLAPQIATAQAQLAEWRSNSPGRDNRAAEDKLRQDEERHDSEAARLKVLKPMLRVWRLRAWIDFWLPRPSGSPSSGFCSAPSSEPEALRQADAAELPARLPRAPRGSRRSGGGDSMGTDERVSELQQ